LAFLGKPLDPGAGMTHDSIQLDRSSITEYEVTTWEETHGEKWKKATDEIARLEGNLVFDEVYKCLESYVKSNFAELRKRMAS